MHTSINKPINQQTQACSNQPCSLFHISTSALPMIQNCNPTICQSSINCLPATLQIHSHGPNQQATEETYKPLQPTSQPTNQPTLPSDPAFPAPFIAEKVGQAMGCLVGWLVGWLIDSAVGWCAGLTVDFIGFSDGVHGMLVGWLVGWLS